MCLCAAYLGRKNSRTEGSVAIGACEVSLSPDAECGTRLESLHFIKGSREGVHPPCSPSPALGQAQVTSV